MGAGALTVTDSEIARPSVRSTASTCCSRRVTCRDSLACPSAKRAPTFQRPGPRRSTRYFPAASVTAVRTTPVSGLSTSTTAPGTVSPSFDRTVPTSDEDVVWALRSAAPATAIAETTSTRARSHRERAMGLAPVMAPEPIHPGSARDHQEVRLGGVPGPACLETGVRQRREACGGGRGGGAEDAIPDRAGRRRGVPADLNVPSRNLVHAQPRDLGARG